MSTTLVLCVYSKAAGLNRNTNKTPHQTRGRQINTANEMQGRMTVLSVTIDLFLFMDYSCLAVLGDDLWGFLYFSC